MPYPKRVPLRRMQVRFRRPYQGEVGPLGESFARIACTYRRTQRADGVLILKVVARKRPERAVLLQALLCAALRHFPEATIADLCDWAGCSRETAHRRKQLALQLNAAYDAKRAAMTAANGSFARRQSL
jgi:hypothetical protein